MALSDSVPEWWTPAASSPGGPLSTSKAAKRRMRRNKLPRSFTYNQACMLQNMPKLLPIDHNFRTTVKYIVIEIPVYANGRPNHDANSQVPTSSDYNYCANQRRNNLYIFSGQDQGLVYGSSDSYLCHAETGLIGCRELYSEAALSAWFGEDLPPDDAAYCDTKATAVVRSTPISIYRSLDFCNSEDKPASSRSDDEEMSCNSSDVPEAYTRDELCEYIQQQQYIGDFQGETDEESCCLIISERDCNLCSTCLQPVSEYCLDFHENRNVSTPDCAIQVAEHDAVVEGSGQGPSDGKLALDFLFIGSGPGPWAGKCSCKSIEILPYISSGSEPSIFHNNHAELSGFDAPAMPSIPMSRRKLRKRLKWKRIRRTNAIMLGKAVLRIVEADAPLLELLAEDPGCPYMRMKLVTLEPRVGRITGMYWDPVCQEKLYKFEDRASEYSEFYNKEELDELIEQQQYMNASQSESEDEGDLVNDQGAACSEHFTRDYSDCKLCFTCLQPLSEYCLDFHELGIAPLPDPATYMAEKMIPERASMFIGSGPGPWAAKLVSKNTNVHAYRSPFQVGTNFVDDQVGLASAASCKYMEAQPANKRG